MSEPLDWYKQLGRMTRQGPLLEATGSFPLRLLLTFEVQKERLNLYKRYRDAPSEATSPHASFSKMSTCNPLSRIEQSRP